MSAVYELAGVTVDHGPKRVLHIERLAIAAGSTTALIGPNGAGKSTLLRVLAFLQPPSAGRVRYAGQPVTRAGLTPLRRRVGLVPQNPYLLRQSVRRNVELGLKLRGVPRAERTARVAAVLDELGLAALATRPSHALSGGELQRVALARVLVLAPDVLLLDEPFTHLDPRATEEMERLIGDLAARRTRTVVFASHDELRARALSHEVLSVLDGRIGPASLVNLFQGTYHAAQRLFDTGRVRLHLADHVGAASRVAIDPAHVVVSPARLESSMRNCFPGRVVGLSERGGEVQVSVLAGERFHALVTHEALQAHHTTLGSEVWVSFKSNAIHVV